MAAAPEAVHATAIAVGQRAVLIRGPVGSGKSDLALRCIALPLSDFVPQPVRLVADDQVMVERDGTRLKASAPAAIFGKLEVRGVGIVEVHTVAAADVVLVVDLVRDKAVERYPIHWKTVDILGLAVPSLEVLAFEGSAPLKLIVALTNKDLPEVQAVP